MKKNCKCYLRYILRNCRTVVIFTTAFYLKDFRLSQWHIRSIISLWLSSFIPSFLLALHFFFTICIYYYCIFNGEIGALSSSCDLSLTSLSRHSDIHKQNADLKLNPKTSKALPPTSDLLFKCSHQYINNMNESEAHPVQVFVCFQMNIHPYSAHLFLSSFTQTLFNIEALLKKKYYNYLHTKHADIFY